MRRSGPLPIDTMARRSKSIPNDDTAELFGSPLQGEGGPAELYDDLSNLLESSKETLQVLDAEEIDLGSICYL
eukprot:SAG11_NODE_310_length_10927_cov_19.887514_6_plen_73_part_00